VLGRKGASIRGRSWSSPDTPSLKNFDALVIGYYEGDQLIYAARTRSGFTPASRAELFKKVKPLEIKECPFANLPEKEAGRWGAGLTAAKMVECRWIKPQLVGQFEFVEWTQDAHLRHARFIGLSLRVYVLVAQMFIWSVKSGEAIFR
jgi:ATP-dependent DNA ligase